MEKEGWLGTHGSNENLPQGGEFTKKETLADDDDTEPSLQGLQEELKAKGLAAEDSENAPPGLEGVEKAAPEDADEDLEEAA